MKITGRFIIRTIFAVISAICVGFYFKSDLLGLAVYAGLNVIIWDDQD